MATAFQEPTAPPAVEVPPPAPVQQISPEALRLLGQELDKLFKQYASDRRLTELKWLRNLRQYLGLYDPEVEKNLKPNASRAYPRITRVKLISVVARIMNLMFPGNERNWELSASPSPEMAPEDVMAAIQQLMAERQGEGAPVELNDEFVEHAVKRLACERAEALTRLIDDQLQELGGDQSHDWVTLNRKVAFSGGMYGLGVLRGPFVREVKQSSWVLAPNGQPQPVTRTIYKPQYDFLPVWDCYPDMSAKTLGSGDGYFTRLVLGRAELRKLADRPDFFKAQVTRFIANNPNGNYKPREFETELKAIGTAAHVKDVGRDPQGKYEVIIWNGPVSAQQLRQVGVAIPDEAQGDHIEAEVWMVGGEVIKADMNPWAKLGDYVQTIHFFQFDEDDTSPIGNGLPNVIRDSQMSICAATRMTLDNASVTCAPQFELNQPLMRADQDLISIEPYKIWYRDDGDSPAAAYPAIRPIQIDGHLAELIKLIELFMQFADTESFVGPATGGDVAKSPSEPMRTAAGASMLRGDAALPFKDIVRNYDSFTQSVILSLVQFNRRFNPDQAREGDYNVIARGATSLIAKEVRGMQLDVLAQTLTPEERDHVDERKFVEQRFAVRDMSSLMVSEEEAERRRQSREAMQAQMVEVQKQTAQAEVRKTLAEAYKSITQGAKNSAAADAQTTNAALAILQHALDSENDDGDNAPKGASARS